MDAGSCEPDATIIYGYPDSLPPMDRASCEAAECEPWISGLPACGAGRCCCWVGPDYPGAPMEAGGGNRTVELIENLT